MSTGAVRYLTLCAKGMRLQAGVDGHVTRRRRVAFLLLDAEDMYLSNIERYQVELAELKTQIDRCSRALMQHVAHCSDGCTRDKTGGLSLSAFENGRAPTHQKPELPRMEVIAARLRQGEALEAIAAEYDRNPYTLRPRIVAAGFSPRDGKPTTKPVKAPRVTILDRSLFDEQPWRDDALCAQTDPESFYPEKGGSTREAKAVCARCTVSAECLDYALDNDERFGIWGGLSERDRRKIARALRGESAPVETEADIRAWALDNDMSVPTHGPVPQRVRDAYDQEHPQPINLDTQESA